MQEIDLPPSEWKSERPKPPEPIFGPGWPVGVAVVVGIFVAAVFSDSTGSVPFMASLGAAVASGLVLQLLR